eukprot:jgi/Chrzof1/7992/UNPLg00043.t1
MEKVTKAKRHKPAPTHGSWVPAAPLPVPAANVPQLLQPQAQAAPPLVYCPPPPAYQMYQQQPQLQAPAPPAYQMYQQQPQLQAPAPPAYQTYQQQPQLQALAPPAYQMYQQQPQLQAPAPSVYQTYQQQPQLQAPAPPAYQMYQQQPQLQAPASSVYQTYQQQPQLQAPAPPAYQMYQQQPQLQAPASSVYQTYQQQPQLQAPAPPAYQMYQQQPQLQACAPAHGMPPSHHSTLHHNDGGSEPHYTEDGDSTHGDSDHTLSGANSPEQASSLQEAVLQEAIAQQLEQQKVQGQRVEEELHRATQELSAVQASVQQLEKQKTQLQEAIAQQLEQQQRAEEELHRATQELSAVQASVEQLEKQKTQLQERHWRGNEATESACHYLPSDIVQHYVKLLGPIQVQKARVILDVLVDLGSQDPRLEATKLQVALAGLLGRDGWTDSEAGHMEVDDAVKAVANTMYSILRLQRPFDGIIEDYKRLCDVGDSWLGQVAVTNGDTNTPAEVSQWLGGQFDAGKLWAVLRTKPASAAECQQFISGMMNASISITPEPISAGPAGGADKWLVLNTGAVHQVALYLDCVLGHLARRIWGDATATAVGNSSQWAYFVTAVLWHMPREVKGNKQVTVKAAKPPKAAIAAQGQFYNSTGVLYAQSVHPALSGSVMEAYQVMGLAGMDKGCCYLTPPNRACKDTAVFQPTVDGVKDGWVRYDVQAARQLLGNAPPVNAITLCLSDNCVGALTRLQLQQALSEALTCPVSIWSMAMTHTAYHEEDCGVGAVNELAMGAPKLWLVCPTQQVGEKFYAKLQTAKDMEHFYKKWCPPQRFSLNELLDIGMRPLLQQPGDIVVSASSRYAVHITCSAGFSVAVASNCHFSQQHSLHDHMSSEHSTCSSGVAHKDQRRHLQRIAEAIETHSGRHAAG